MSKATDERATPRWVIEWLIHGCGVHIWLDVCATEENAVCRNFLSAEDDGLLYDWRLTCRDMRENSGRWERGYYTWMNPPYSRGQVAQWLDKAIHEWRHNRVQTIALLPQDMSTKWAGRLWEPVNGVGVAQHPLFQMIFLEGRLHFEEMETGAKFPSVIAVIGKPLPREMPMITRANARKLAKEWG